MSLIDYVLKITSEFDGKGFQNLSRILNATQQSLNTVSNYSSRSFKNLNDNLSATRNKLDNIRQLTGKLFGANLLNYAVSFGKQLVQSSKELGAYESRFYAITESEQLANEELQWTFNLAKKTATNIETLTDAYSIFYATARKSLGQDNTRLIMQDWAEIARVTHLSGDAFGRVMYAMRELSSKGAIYADDIKRQLGSAVPNAIEHARKAAEDLGITGVDWWDKLQKTAKNNQPLVNKFMIQFTKHAHEALASPEALRKSLEQTDSVLTALSNTWKLFQYNLAQSGGTRDIIKTIQQLNGLLEKVAKHAPEIWQIIKVLTVLFVGGAIVKKGIEFYNVVKAIVAFVGPYITALFRLNKLLKAGVAFRLISKLGSMKIFGRFLPLLARFLPFLTNPGVLGAVLLASLIPVGMWVLKKFFPNVYKKVDGIFDIIWQKLLQMYMWFLGTPLGKQLTEADTKAEIDRSNSAFDKTKQDIKVQGGLYGNTKYGGFWDVLSTQEKLKALERQLMKSNVMPLETKKKIAVEINHKISSDGTLSPEAINKLYDEVSNIYRNQPFWYKVFGNPM